MARPLGTRQAETLARLALAGGARIQGDSITDSLVRRGLMCAWGDDGRNLVTVTADGYRALADMIDAGTCPVELDPREWIKNFKKRQEEANRAR